VKKYVATMKAGKWTLSPQPIVLSSDLTMVDGQHRMEAVVQSGTSQWFMFTKVPDDSFSQAIDRGRSRTHGDILEMAGAVKKGQGKRVSAIARCMYSGETETVRPSEYESVAFDVLKKSGGDIQSVIGHLKYVSSFSAPIIAALAYVYPCNPELVASICKKVSDNDGLSKGTGAWHIRRLSESTGYTDWTESQKRFLDCLRALQIEFEGKTLKSIYRTKSEDSHMSLAHFRNLREKIGVGKHVLLPGDTMSKTIVTEEEIVTPEMAKSFMAKVHPKQRSVSMTNVKRYSEVMKAGGWDLTPHGIVFDSDGHLVDGQHRLLAVIDCGIEQMFTIHRLPKGMTVRGIDRGHRRTHGHIMEMLGLAEKGQGRDMSAALRALQCLFEDRTECPDFESEAEEIFKKSGKDIAAVIAMGRPKGFKSAAVTAAMAYAYPCDPELVSRIFNRVVENDGLEKGTGSWHLNKMINERVAGRPSNYDSLETSYRVLTFLQLEFEDKRMDRPRTRSSANDVMEPKSLSFFKNLRRKKKIGEEIS